MNVSTGNQDSGNYNGFAIASVVFGTLAILSCCTALFPIPLSALGLIFVILSRRSGKPMSTLSIVGLILCIIGLLLGVFYTWYLVVYYIIPMYTDPDFMQNLIDSYKNNYGIDLSQYMNQFPNY